MYKIEDTVTNRQILREEAQEPGLKTFEHYTEPKIDSLMPGTEADSELIKRIKPAFLYGLSQRFMQAMNLH